MDLYRVLRLSFYALAAVAVLPLAIAEHNLLCSAWLVCAGLVAGLAVDRGRIPPVRPVFVYVLALALLVYYFMPLRDEEAWHKQGLAAGAHFLCVFPAFLFFLAYGNAVLVVTGAAALALVIISGILDPGPGLFLRMAGFVGVSAWTLLLHSLWRTREDFSAHRLEAHIPTSRLEARSTSGVPLLSERALRQGLILTAVLSAAGLALGLFLFFSAPRVNETMTRWLEPFIGNREPLPGSATQTGPHGPSEGRSTTGSEEHGLSVNNLGPLYSNHSPALAVTFQGATPELLATHGRILLRGQALSEYEQGRWQVPALAQDASLRPPGDPSAPGVTYRGVVFHQELVPSEALKSRVCFSAGPVERLSIAGARADTEGNWHAAGSAGTAATEGGATGEYLGEPYEVWSYPPVRAADLPAEAEAVHPDRRYLLDGLPQYVRADVLEFALQITKGGVTALQKIQHIVAKLRDSRLYSYTWQLDELKRRGEPLAEFLLSPEALERRGHCGYFASAFVVLCRLNRIPARLAAGFAAPLPADWKDGASREVLFRNSDAHAWGEVFFKGRGWVAFDPTPAAAVAPPSVAVSAAETLARPAAAQPTLLTRIWTKILGYSGKEQQALYRKVSEPLGGAGSVLTGEGRGGWLGAVLAWAGAVLAVWWMMQAFLRRGRRAAPRRTAGAARARAAVAFYNDLLQALSRRGFVRKPGQTPREFAAQVRRQGGQAFESVLGVTEVFENVRYGGREISQEEFNRLQEALDHLRELTFVGAG